MRINGTLVHLLKSIVLHCVVFTVQLNKLAIFSQFAQANTLLMFVGKHHPQNCYYQYGMRDHCLAGVCK